MTPDQIADYLSSARWFAGKGRAFEVTAVTSLTLAPNVATHLVTVTFDSGETDVYQLPLSSYAEPQERLAHAAVGWWDGLHHYDAVHDKDAMQVWLHAFAGKGTDALDPRVLFTRTGDHELDLEAHSTLFSGEQSNSSLAFGEDALLKVFRRVEPGTNPDIEIHEVLTRAGNTHVAALYGHVTATLEDTGTFELALLQQFLRTASDGWELALASVRNLVRETDLQPEEAGGDFAAEAHRLGANLAEVHAVLADAFGTGPLDGVAVATAMQARLDDAASIVPEIAAHADALAARLATVATIEGQQAQRVHGDLHLGQTLRTSLGWKLVDFEGEPAKSLDERRLPDSGWRDLAGMIRSFDYAASTVVRDLGSDDGDAGEIAYRADTWTAHTTAAFLAGYTEQRGAAMTDAEGALLRAYTADKAIYEAVYETRNRPSWVEIPLAALVGIAGGPA
ncbi:MAG: maltokinase N-terminal cap-like domain-containing protein [Marmoricola sp.]